MGAQHWLQTRQGCWSGRGSPCCPDLRASGYAEVKVTKQWTVLRAFKLEVVVASKCWRQAMQNSTSNAAVYIMQASNPCLYLVYRNLGSNQIHGSLPSGLFTLTNLQSLWVRDLPFLGWYEWHPLESDASHKSSVMLRGHQTAPSTPEQHLWLLTHTVWVLQRANDSASGDQEVYLETGSQAALMTLISVGIMKANGGAHWN